MIGKVKMMRRIGSRRGPNRKSWKGGKRGFLNVNFVQK
jgi:hypothetical protein